MNSAKLICTTDEFVELRNEIGVADFVIDQDERIGLMAQISAYAAKIYDLSEDELKHILETFPGTVGGTLTIEEMKKIKELTLSEFFLLKN